MSETPPAPLVEEVDSFSNDVWRSGQYRIDWERCRAIEQSDSFPTPWPTNFLFKP